MDESKRVLEALERLSKSLTSLDDSSSNHALSHWREIPEEVATAYDMMQKGASLVEATSTKYTLVGKIDFEEGSKLSQNLLRGCELLGTGALLICNDDIGCGRSTRHYAKQAARAVVSTVLALMEAFIDQTALDDNVGAQKTGAVWQQCASLQKVPKGNRASMRRDLLTWTMECNETMTEFTELVEAGPELSTISEEKTDCDDFSSESEQYTLLELPVANASVSLLKCSRGTINVAIKACEAAGEQLSTDNREGVLEWINSLFNMARIVGEGVTDLGTQLYPPLELGRDSGLQKQLVVQRDTILALHTFCLDASPNGMDGLLSLPEEVTEMSSKLQTAAQKRYQETQDAIAAAGMIT